MMMMMIATNGHRGGHSWRMLAAACSYDVRHVRRWWINAAAAAAGPAIYTIHYGLLFVII